MTLRDLALAEGSDGAIRNFGTLRLVSTQVLDSTGNRSSSIVLNRGRLQMELVKNARMHDNFVAHGVNGVLNLGRGSIEGETASTLVRGEGQ